MSRDGLEPVIGLEIHVQLATRTKMFCGDPVEFGAAPNTHVCPVCLGLPGALPVPNLAAVGLGVRAALGLNCTVHGTSLFARKQYFYPDLPKGYQITQYDRPMATGGWLDIPAEDAPDARVRIRRVHLEEDAGKLIHDRVPGATAIDLNRAGVPLVEIVTEPDLRGPAHARAFLVRLKQLLQYLDVSDCDMEKGSLRVDANLSIRRVGARELGAKTEVKNLNSFSNVERALRYEADRQVALVAGGGMVEHQTLLWDAGAAEARPTRGKEEAQDYRYFPDPDLPALVLPEGLVERTRRELPEAPATREERFVQQYGLPAYDAGVLTASRELADYFETVAAAAGDPKAASNWVMTDVLGWLNQRGATVAGFPIPATELASLVRLVRDGTLSHTLARRVFELMAETGRSAGAIVEAEGLARVVDEGTLRDWVEAVVEEEPEAVARFRAGDQRLMAFLMGRVMKRSGGRADPGRVAELLRSRLGR